ncbi:PREDICTED: probable ATP-dependent RNA helicase DDX49 [Thamnophis sirtalis]|uniref:RNA helicase n=1 Tax=Thamnophis sirtalis TaxID=35019 RepID=A0A6I9XSH9_9SAUR|nr:PREDICTED: probable ATP-dependent RNA helicase DDX49 [Thamnophis sirtalis]
MAGFRALGLDPWLASQAEQLGLSRPTPVQEACIPPALQEFLSHRSALCELKATSHKVAKKQRFAALAKFKSSVFKILIATDVAARGLDIPTVQVVINHNTPGLPKIYIHRVGRTARAGRHGIAITLVTQYDIHLIHAVEEQIKMKLQEFSTEEQKVLKILTQVNVVRRECEIRLEATDFDEKKEINKRKQMILEGKDPDLEMQRKAELAKIKKKKLKFQSQVHQTLQERQQKQLQQKLRKQARRKKQKQAK